MTDIISHSVNKIPCMGSGIMEMNAKIPNMQPVSFGTRRVDISGDSQSGG
jgi:hypothetical protein